MKSENLNYDKWLKKSKNGESIRQMGPYSANEMKRLANEGQMRFCQDRREPGNWKYVFFHSFLRLPKPIPHRFFMACILADVRFMYSF